jgi:hypothetical protein
VAAVGRHEKMNWAHIILGKVRATVPDQSLSKIHQGKPPWEFSDIFAQNIFHQKTFGNFRYFEQFPRNVAQND